MSGRQTLALSIFCGNVSTATAYRRALQQAHKTAAAAAGEQRLLAFSLSSQTERAHQQHTQTNAENGSQLSARGG